MFDSAKIGKNERKGTKVTIFFEKKCSCFFFTIIFATQINGR